MFRFDDNFVVKSCVSASSNMKMVRQLRIRLSISSNLHAKTRFLVEFSKHFFRVEKLLLSKRTTPKGNYIKLEESTLSSSSLIINLPEILWNSTARSAKTSSQGRIRIVVLSHTQIDRQIDIDRQTHRQINRKLQRQIDGSALKCYYIPW